jgi:hypothetical protein
MPDARLEREPSVQCYVPSGSRCSVTRATEMGRRGELNVAQLVRERWDGDTFLLGFTTARGTVTAASDWGGEAERKRVRAPGGKRRSVPRCGAACRRLLDAIA